jgi:hypothetical protein
VFAGDAHGNASNWMGEVGEEGTLAWVQERGDRVIADAGANDGANKGKDPSDAPAESLAERREELYDQAMIRRR